jgi:xanthine dehydrogenase accessory factor
MALTADGRISGSVSGGCVEGAVIEAGRVTIETGKPQLLHFGVADETAWDVGLACGGNIDIFVDSLDQSTYEMMRDFVLEDWAGSVVTVIGGPEALIGQRILHQRDGATIGSFGSDLDEPLFAILRGVQRAQRISLGEDVEVFVDLYRPAPSLILVGGVHVAIALSSLAKSVGYGTTVVDPRRAFGSEERFPEVDQVIQKWPRKALQEIGLTADTAVALLTHDPKIDDQALEIALNSDAFYIGALGSRKTHAKRKRRLEQMGFNGGQIAKIHAPIGLPIGAENPEEIALAIMAEIVGVRRGAVS